MAIILMHRHYCLLSFDDLDCFAVYRPAFHEFCHDIRIVDNNCPVSVRCHPVVLSSLATSVFHLSPPNADDRHYLHRQQHQQAQESSVHHQPQPFPRLGEILALVLRGGECVRTTNDCTRVGMQCRYEFLEAILRLVYNKFMNRASVGFGTRITQPTRESH